MKGQAPRAMWRGCALGLALLLVVGGAGAQQQQSDEERIVELEEELQELREAARGRLSCTAEGGFLSITPIEDDGDVTGYTITNVTSADDAGLTVLEVALSNQDTDIVLPGMVVRISGGAGAAEEAGADSASSPFEIDGLEDLTGGMDVWGVIGGNLLTWVFGCAFFSVVVVLEKKYQCIGGEKIHEMVEQHRYLQKELKDVIHVIKGEDPESPSAADAAVRAVEGAEDMELGGPGLTQLVGGHKAEVGKGVGMAATLMRAKHGDANAKRMLATEALGAAHKLEHMTPEEMMAQGKHTAQKTSEAYHKVADDERTQRVLSGAKEKGSETFHKVAEVADAEHMREAVAVGKEKGQLAVHKGTEAAAKAKAASDSRKGRFGRKPGGGESGGMKAKRGGGFEFKGKGSKPGSGSKDTGTKFQNPMLGRVSMSNPMSRSNGSPKASGDKSLSLLGSELSVVDDDGED